MKINKISVKIERFEPSNLLDSFGVALRVDTDIPPFTYHVQQILTVNDFYSNFERFFKLMQLKIIELIEKEHGPVDKYLK